MSDNEIYYHVGLERTGTTFLQKSVFPWFEDIRYIPKRDFPDAIDIIKSEQHSRYLVSKEPMVDDHFEPEIAGFARHFPDAQTIVVFRPQPDWALSQLKRFIKNGFRMMVRDLVDLENDRGMFRQEHLEYVRKIEILERHFEKSPLVLLYDDLRAHPVGFVETLAELTGAKVDLDKISLKPRHTSYNLRQLNVLLRVMKYVNIERERPRKKGLHHSAHRLWKDLVRYSAIYVAHLTPKRNLKPLLPEDYRAKLEERYAQDWNTITQRAIHIVENC